MDVLIIGLAIYLTLSLLAAFVVMAAIVAGSRSDELLDEGRLVVPGIDPPQTARPLSGAEGA
ncbi:MAG: hypothetical protein ACRDON_09690 [Gaiellaceae bacterium]